MSELSAEFMALSARRDTGAAADLPALRAHYRELRAEFDPLLARAVALKDTTQKDYESHWGTLGLREKYLRGWFGGDKNAVKKKAELKTQLKELTELHQQMTSWSFDLEFAVRQRVKQMTRAADPEFDHLCNEEARYQKAGALTSTLIQQAQAVLDAIGKSSQADRAAAGASEADAQGATQRAEGAYKEATSKAREFNKHLQTYVQSMSPLGISTQGLVPPAAGMGKEIAAFVLDALDLGSRKPQGLEKARQEMEGYKLRAGRLKSELKETHSQLERQVTARVKQEWGVESGDQDVRELEQVEETSVEEDTEGA